MPRRCLCDRLRQRIATDARLATLPMAAKWMWLTLAERAAETPDGVLRLGSAFGFLTGIAMLIQAAETEVETHWETLAARGLVVREGDAVTLPDLPMQAARASVARANGAAGGRPRRGETPEQARLRRAQASLMLPVEGGVGKPTGTEPGNPEVSVTTTTVESVSVSSSPPPKPAREETPSSIGAAVAELAGLDPIRQRFDYLPVRDWLAAGMTRAFILETVGQVVDRPGYQPGRISSLRYFDRALRAAWEDAAPPSRRAEPERPANPRAAAIEAWIASGMDWSSRPEMAA